ncbi:MAG TPA: IclR family transcriptional regulator [Syntrophales bacterium]|nr:IclR family transcriptional regulator [Syntrophales bacterium]
MRSLERALHLLTIMENVGWPMTVTEIGRDSQLSKATALRLLSVLEKYGLAEKRQGRYRLGIAVLPLAHSYVLRNELGQTALPVMQELAQASGETVSLFVRLGFQRVSIQRVEGDHPLQHTSPSIGQRLPLHLGLGKVLAAAMPEEELQKMLTPLDEVYFANGTRWTRKAFLADLNRIRRQGYCISRNERVMGATSLAAPIVDRDGATIAGIGIVSSTERMTPKKLERFSIEIRGAAKVIAGRYCGD